MRPVAGVDIGGTKIAVALDGPHAETLVARTPREPSEIVATVIRLVRQAAGPLALAGVGVGSAGIFDHHGTVIAATDLIPHWTGTPLAARLTAELQVPVIVLNDVDATALGEATAGAGRGVSRLLVAATGTGLGGAFVLDGVVQGGDLGAAGLLGHVALPGLTRICSCGLTGHAEPHASGPGIERTFVETGGPVITLQEIGVLARAGDERALNAIRSGGRALGRALAASATLFGPELLVVGGGAAQLGDLLLEPARAAYRTDVAGLSADVPIVPAGLGTRAAIIGAHAAIRAHTEGT